MISKFSHMLSRAMAMASSFYSAPEDTSMALTSSSYSAPEPSSMALASSSYSAPENSSWKYDVFLSFRGEDTRNTFVDHLYSALSQRPIRTYKDDEALPRGESIGPSLFKAIEESKFAVIIFSKNYADSSWCLKELVHIMKCKEERGLIVMPVFYDVDPSDVRKQKRKFGEAFAKHEETEKTHESWRKALVDASNIAGWEPKNIANGSESAVIKRIVDTILDTLLEKLPLPTTFYQRPDNRCFSSSDKLLSISSEVEVDDDDFIGMKDRLQDLKTQLEVGSSDVRMVGIWGVGGGGKTTLANYAYMEIRHHFEACCVVENIREESHKYGLKKLQENILSVVLKKTVVVPSVVEGKRMLKEMLCHSNVLILLDDVDDVSQLEALAGSHSWFGSGSRIIITTRDEHLLRTHKVDKVYHVILLSNEEAIQLFNKRAYNKEKPVKDYEKLSLSVVSYAAGLPLALKVLGSFLYDKDEMEWMSTLARLKDIPKTEILQQLEISYDGLEPVEKELFLDIACFFRGKRTDDTDDAMKILEVCDYHPKSGIKVLRQKSLINIVNGRFDMHDLVQEMGHYIVRREHRHNPEKHSRVWIHEEINNMCLGDSTTVNDKIEAIKYNVTDSPCLFDSSMASSSYSPHPNRDDRLGLSKIVSNMKNLRWLDLKTYYDEFVEGPNFLSNELRYINWTFYPSSTFPDNFQPLKLVVLKMDYSLQKELWKGYKRLPHLKVLQLVSMKNLLRTPDFDGLPCLQELTLSDCPELKEIHFGNHRRYEYPLPHLKVLQLSMMDKLLRTPDFDGLPCLQELTISHCPELEEIHFGNHRRLEYRLPHLEVLQLNSMKNLLRTPDFDELPCLKKFTIDDCPELEEIDASFGNHRSLKYVDVSACHKLKKVPKIICMEKLETLGIYGCEVMLEFPEIQANMGSLLNLVLESNHGIQVLPSSIGEHCTHLRSLHLYSWDIKKIEFDFHALKHLKELRLSDISGCHLKDGDIGSLSNLQELDLSDNSFTRLPFSLLELTQLKLLRLNNCENLVELPKLPSSILNLEAKDCRSLATIKDNYTSCKWLCDVSLTECANFIDGSRLLESMLQGNAVENHSMFLQLQGLEIAKGFRTPLIRGRRCKLQLPENWSNDSCGFLLCFVTRYDLLSYPPSISMKHLMSDITCEDDAVWEASDVDKCTLVWYVSFGSLRHTTWSDETKNVVSFSIDSTYTHDINGFGATLVSGSKTSTSTSTTQVEYDFADYIPIVHILKDSLQDLCISAKPTKIHW